MKNRKHLNTRKNAASDSPTTKSPEERRAEYFKKAAVISTPDGLHFMQTNKPTAEYLVGFTIKGIHKVRADSAEVACEWVETRSDYCYNPPYQVSYIGECNITSCYVEDEKGNAFPCSI
jgi:hypothetical protein